MEDQPKQIEVPQEFIDMLVKDPGLLSKMARQSELSDFKGTYNVERASPLRCPACNQYGVSGGSLWRVIDQPNFFVCRKCKLRWKMEWLDGDLNDLILKIKEANR